MIKSESISIVIQGTMDGKNTLKCLKQARKTFPKAEIIFSTWHGYNIPKRYSLFYDILILSNDPGGIITNDKIHNLSNINRQIISTKAGLEAISREYTLKIRSDLIVYTDNFLNYFNSFPQRDADYSMFSERIIIPSLYTRKYIGRAKSFYEADLTYCTPMLYHPSDWFMFGKTEDIKKLFNIKTLKEPEHSRYFAFHNKNTSNHDWLRHNLWKFSPEQSILVNSIKKNWKKISISHYLDFNYTTIDESTKFMVNNFIILDPKQMKIGIEKNPYKKFAKQINLFDDYNFYGLYRNYIFLRDYKKYCDKNIRIPFIDFELIKHLFRFNTFLKQPSISRDLKKINELSHIFIRPIIFIYKLVIKLPTKLIYTNLLPFIEIIVLMLRIAINGVLYYPNTLVKIVNNYRRSLGER